MRRALCVGIALVLAVPLVMTQSISSAPASAEEPDAGSAPLTERLIEATEQGVTAPEQLAEELSLPETGAGSMSFDAENRVIARVLLTEAPNEALQAAVAEYAEIDRVLPRFLALTVRVNPDQIPALLEIPGVESVTPALAPATGSQLSQAVTTELQTSIVALTQAPDADAPTQCGPIPIEAAAPLNVDTARERFDVDGTGVTIGVISDSFNQNTEALTTWADDVASGALPGAGNPCGYETPVTIVSDLRDDGSDEGRAMAQLVHGIAPGARLLFADSGLSEEEMGTNILDLAEAGADIIVDDITFLTEPYFQQGVISSAIEEVKADYGVTYFTSAGNSNSAAATGASAGAPLGSWQTSEYRATECPAWVPQGEGDPLFDLGTYDCLDFDPDPSSAVPYDTFQIASNLLAPSVQITPLASIGESAYGVTTGYQLRFYEVTAGVDTPRLIGGAFSINENTPSLFGAVQVNRGSEVRMVMVRTAHDETQPNPAVYLGFSRGAQAIAERAFMGNGQSDLTGPTVFGHGGDGSGIGVASLHWDDPEEVRWYSSLGPNTMRFAPMEIGQRVPAAALPAPVQVASPQIAAVDGTRTTFFGETDEHRFFGTSAAAPNAAAVAALGLEYAPQLSGAELADAVRNTARGTADGGPVNPFAAFDVADTDVFGSGIVDADRLIDSLPAPAPGDVAVTATSTESVTIAWAERGAPSGYTVNIVPASDTARAAVNAAPVTLPAGTTTHTFTGLAANTGYVITLAAVNSAGVETPVSLEATTAAVPEPEPEPKPQPEPKPEPETVTPSGNNSGGTDQLSRTGADGWAPLWIGGAALLLAGAGLLGARKLRSRRTVN